MTEKKFNESISYIYRQFENIQLSKVNVERLRERYSDILNIIVRDTVTTNIQVGYMFSDCHKWLYVSVNGIDVCSIKNTDITLQVFYDNIEATLLNMLDDIERL